MKRPQKRSRSGNWQALPVLPSCAPPHSLSGFFLTGLLFWMPQIVQSSGLSGSLGQTGLLVMSPYLLSVIVMYAWSRHSDASGDRRIHVAVPFVFAAVFLVALALPHGGRRCRVYPPFLCGCRLLCGLCPVLCPDARHFPAGAPGFRHGSGKYHCVCRGRSLGRSSLDFWEAESRGRYQSWYLPCSGLP